MEMNKKLNLSMIIMIVCVGVASAINLYLIDKLLIEVLIWIIIGTCLPLAIGLRIIRKK
jgi:hypothetical protein